jgi:hypothetical protein
MTREEEIANEAVEAAIADTGKGRSRDYYYINALADHENGFNEGFIAGAKWADEHPNWISVEEELPTPSTKVLVYQGLEEAVPGYFSHDGTFKDRDGYKLADVTHWMPLPNVPKGGEQ